MTGVFYLAAIFGVMWLALWSLLDRTEKKPFWMPFDYKEPNTASEASPSLAESSGSQLSWRSRAAETRRKK